MEGANPGQSPASAVTVSVLNASVRELLESTFQPLWVRGEIGNWRRHGSGHRYFSLRDGQSQVGCVMFRSDARSLPTDPEDGMEVCAFGRLTLYEAGGKYQIIVRTIEAVGEGLWRLAFDRLRSTLASEGLLDPGRKRPLPAFPARIGIVTSRTGAALRDIVTIIRRRAPWTSVLVSDCRVQGREAGPEIVDALLRVVRDGTCDVVIVTRGGGSVEDLWAFNEEVVARAIVACPVPVVSAVGHEVDFTIADLVADQRAPTPSAAAELVVPEMADLRRRLRHLSQGLSGGLRAMVTERRESTTGAARELLRRTQRALRDRSSRLEGVAGRLDALSPVATLRRGYAVPLGKDGTVLRRGDMFAPGDHIALRLVDALVACRVEEISGLSKGRGT